MTLAKRESNVDIARRIERNARSLNELDLKVDETEKRTSRDLVNFLLHSVIGQTQPKRNLGEDASAVRKATRLILEASDDGTLSKDEADAVIQFIAEGFAQRRIDNVFDRLSSFDNPHWFIATSKSSYER
ncbi:hypothetical protein [Salinisphaera sp. T5B8]|uniref:hypothetical protein n=1 Tax=Salinisphaera sp. T5B8 TaxID=1304154 RepID=UPI00333F5514